MMKHQMCLVFFMSGIHLVAFEVKSCFKSQECTCDAPTRPRSIHKRVLPLLTEPPNLVNKVWASILNFDLVTATLGLNVMMGDVPLHGIWWVNVLL